MNFFWSAWSSSWLQTNEHQVRLVFSSIIGALAVTWILLLLVKKPNNTNPPLPPGPKGFPLLGNLLSLDPELHTYFTGLAKTYGPIYSLRLGRKIGIVISSPELAKEVLKDQDATFANRDAPVAGKEATYGGANILLTSYGPEWRMLRKVCVTQVLGHSTLESVYWLRRREVRRTIGYLYGKAGTPVNVGEQMFLTFLNVITSMLWGGTVKGEERAELAAEFKQVVGGITRLIGLPNLSDFFPELERFDLQGIQKKTRVLAKRFDGIFETLFDEREKMISAGDEMSKDFLQILLQLVKEGGDAKIPLTITHVKAVFMDMVVGGTDTTSNAMEYALAEMMNNPQILTKVQQEVETVVGKDNIVEESHVSKLPYLHSVMKETLRLHPLLPLLVPHCPSATTTVAGYTVPKGSRVFLNVWAVHRDPSIWDSPSEFRPERFSDGKWDFSGNDLTYFPFGSGRRTCPGNALAERMFMYSLASLIHSFDWSMPVGEKLDLEDKFGIVLKKKSPLLAVPTPRLSNPSLYE